MPPPSVTRWFMVHTIWEWDLGEAWGLFPTDRDMAGQDPLPELTRRAATIRALTLDLIKFWNRLPRRPLHAKTPIPTRAHRAMLLGKDRPRPRAKRLPPPRS